MPRHNRTANSATAKKASDKRSKDTPGTKDEHGNMIDIVGLGEGLKMTSSEIISLSHEEAERFLHMAEFAGERNVREEHVRYLVAAMKRKTFLWELANLAECRCQEAHNGNPKGTVYRMNGQHTCWARLEMPAKSYRAPVRLFRYTAKTVADMRRLYSSIDRGGERSKNNIVFSYLAGRQEFEGIKTGTVKNFPAALMLWRYEDRQKRRAFDGDAISYLILTEFQKIYIKVATFLSSFSQTDIKHVQRSASVAAMFATFDKSPVLAADFWRCVITGADIPSVDDPRGRLRTLLLSTRVGADYSEKDMRTVTTEEMYRICINAWNSLKKGKHVKSLRATKQRQSVM